MALERIKKWEAPVRREKEKRGKEVDLYSAYRQYNSTTKRSDVDHTELPANTPHLPFVKCQKKSFLSCPPLFLALQVQSVVLVSASVWSVQFDHFLVFLLFLLSVPRAQSFVKVWARAPVPWMESASLSCYSFTPESIIKQPFNVNA